MTPEEFRRQGHRMVDLIADYRATVAQRPVRPPVAPGDIRARLPAQPPVEAESFEGVYRDLHDIILPGLTHWQHPAFFGYFPANAELASVLGDQVSTGLGVIGLSWQSAPALTELEEVVTDWVRQMVGLSGSWSGVLQDTASSSTLVALVCARERASEFSLARGGLQGAPAPLAVYYSAHAHSSVEKAALLAGFGRDNLRAIATDADHALRVDALEAAMVADRARGVVPAAIVATTGTTCTTALDPIASIAAVAQREQVWLHVDAAMAGAAMVLPECRWMWEGIERADSLVLNAHKWLGAVFDCSVYCVRDPRHLVRVMSTNPSYLQSGVDAQVKNYRDWGIPLGRRFRALKLWFLIREQGVAGLAARLRRDLGNAEWLAAQVRAAHARGWRLLAPVPLQTVCVRHEPVGLFGEALDRHTLAWVERINASGAAYLTAAQLDGRWMVRISIGGLQTERAQVEALWELLQRTADAST